MDEPKLTESDIEELRGAFFAQAGEILETLPGHIIAVEEKADEESWKALKRAFHTLKGDSKAMGFVGLSAFAHKVEDLIADLKGKVIDRASIDLLLECADAFGEFIDKLAGGEEPDTSGIARKIESRIKSGAAEGRKTDPSGVKKTFAREQAFLRIEPERVDKIMNLIGELVIVRSALAKIAADIGILERDSVSAGLENINLSFERSLTDLQRSVMKVRMLPVGYVFKKFPRIIRDLSGEMEKKVRLELHGEKTELDKSIIDVIGEPLLHLVRNAIDHGIESPEERIAARKPEEGLISMKAYHQGSQIVLEVKDDGRGINIEALKENALQRGILTADDSRKMPDKEAMNLVFVSGFSTAGRVTEVSGRGVGMDIIKGAVESLRGIIDIDTDKGKGTTVYLRLPLTLAIIKAILFRDASGTFALPLASVTEILRALPEDIATVAGLPVLRHRDSIIPILSVNSGHFTGKFFIILIGVAELRAGIIAEKIIGEENLVIKALDKKISSGIAAGASILGDGKVVLILDPLLLIKKRSPERPSWRF